MSILAIIFIYRLGYRIAFARLRDMKYALNMTFGFFISRLSGVIYMNSGVFILGLFCTPTTIALYSLAEQCYKVMISAFSPVFQSIYPYMAREKDLSFLIRISFICISFALFGVALAYFIAPYLIKLIFGIKWVGIISILNILFVAVILDLLVGFSGYPLCVILGQLRIANLSAILGAIFYLISASTMLILKFNTAEVFAALIVSSQLFVLIYRGIFLRSFFYSILKNM
jgi:PST family polysaccharide transporter